MSNRTISQIWVALLTILVLIMIASIFMAGQLSSLTVISIFISGITLGIAIAAWLQG